MASISYRTQIESAANLTNYTFSSVDIGAASATRVVVVGIASVASSGSRQVNVVAIAGVSATLAIRRSSSNQYTSELWYAAVPSGTTGNIDVNHNGAMISCSIGVWALYDLASSAPFDTAQSVSAGATIDIPLAGIVVANAHTGGGDVSWVGATEDFDNTALGDAPQGHSGASRQATAAETGTTVSTSSVGNYLAVASWSPAPSGVVGDVDITEADDTLASTGALAITGALSKTEAPDTASSTGALPIVATLGGVEAPDTIASTASIALQATASMTEVGDTILADGTGATMGVASITEAPNTASSAGAIAIAGSLFKTEAPNTLSSAGAIAITGSLSKTEGGDTLSSAATLVNAGSLAATEAPDTISAIGRLAIRAVALLVEARDFLVSIGERINGPGRGRVGATGARGRVVGRSAAARTSASPVKADVVGSSANARVSATTANSKVTVH